MMLLLVVLLGMYLREIRTESIDLPLKYPLFRKEGARGRFTISTYPKPISPSFQYGLFQHSRRGCSDKTNRHDLRMFLYFQPQFLLRFLNNPPKSLGKSRRFFEYLEKPLLLKSDLYKAVTILLGQSEIGRSYSIGFLSNLIYPQWQWWFVYSADDNNRPYSHNAMECHDKKKAKTHRVLTAL